MISVSFKIPDRANAGGTIHACMIALTLKSLNPAPRWSRGLN